VVAVGRGVHRGTTACLCRRPRQASVIAATRRAVRRALAASAGASRHCTLLLLLLRPRMMDVNLGVISAAAAADSDAADGGGVDMMQCRTVRVTRHRR